MKSIIKSTLSQFDLKITHNRDDFWSDQLSTIELISFLLLSNINKLAILQIGANDGSENDWVQSLIDQSIGTAVLIEPLPEPYARLHAKHKHHKNVQCLNVAIASHKGHETLYYAHFANNCPPRYSRIASFKKQTIAKHAKSIKRSGGKISSMSVPVVTADDLVNMFPGTNVDLVGIDAEGFDTTVVNLLLDTGIHPSMIVYEHNHARGADDKQCRERLRNAGYLLARINRDTVAVDAEKWSRILRLQSTGQDK